MYSMKNFLDKISDLDAVANVLLLSRQSGELLFADNYLENREDSLRWQTCWRVVIPGLGEPENADFIFEKGRYFLKQTTIGWLIVGMRNDSNLNTIRIACDSVAKKLQAPDFRQQTLLRLLHQAEDGLKPHVIKELMSSADKQFGKALTDLLSQRETFAPDQQEKLTLTICQALGYCPYPQAIPSLKSLISGSPSPSMVSSAARIAIRQLEEFAASQPQPKVLSPEPVVEPGSPPEQPDESSTAVEKADADNRPITSAQVREALQRGDRDTAVSLLTDLVEEAATNEDFSKAEQLCSWLVEVAPLATDNIIRAENSITHAKQASIPPEYLNRWRSLVETIGTDAFASLYHSLNRQQSVAGEIIAFQGQLLKKLFFINEGNVLLDIVCKDGEEHIAELGPGQIFGAEAFFQPTVWTINARSHGADLFTLSPEGLRDLQLKFPRIAQHLAGFCDQPPLGRPYFEASGTSRRQSHRVTASNRATITSGSQLKSEEKLQLQGKLVDISQHGLSLRFHGMQKSVAESFLGSLITLAITSSLGEKYLERTGSVRAIGLLDAQAGSYLLHIELMEILSGEELQLLGIDNY